MGWEWVASWGGGGGGIMRPAHCVGGATGVA